MKYYSAKGNGELALTETEALTNSDLVKLKINSVLPTKEDIGFYEGKYDKNYPIVPCRIATAIVSEDRPEYGLKLGSRVIINPYISINESETYQRTEEYGIDRDGFLRDFVSLPIDNIIQFPEEVKDEEGLFTYYIAEALAVINSMELQKGEYIAVIGGSTLSNIICQLALYYQAIPILVSASSEQIKLAEKCGVYYTVNETTEDTAQKVSNITGGRMAEHTVLCVGDGVSTNFLFTLAVVGGDCTIASLSEFIPRIETEIGVISTKGLKVKGVSSGENEINSAVNILAQKLLKLDNFIDKRVSFDEVPSFFSEESKGDVIYYCPVIKV